MKAKCGECGYEHPIDVQLLRKVVGGGLLGLAAYGWSTYLFAGVLGFYGGAALIALALLAGGGSLLAGKDFGAITYVGKKLTDLLNEKAFPCAHCGASKWLFAGFEGAEVISGADHKRELTKALTSATNELCIASGFLSSKVVNDRFLQSLTALLEKRVSVTLIFSDSRSHSDWMREGYEEAVEALNSVAETHAELRLVQKHTHEKGIIVDRHYAIVGSFNFLSNEKVVRDETSLKISESKAVEKIRREFLT